MPSQSSTIFKKDLFSYHNKPSKYSISIFSKYEILWWQTTFIPFHSDLYVGYLWIFQVDHTFYKLDVKIFAANNEIRCVSCSCPLSSSSTLDPCQQKHLLFWHYRKNRLERVWKSIQFVIFKPWKVLWNWIDYYWNSYCYVRWIFKKVLAKAMQNLTF